MLEVWPVYRDVSFQGAMERVGWASGLLIFYILLHLLILKLNFQIDRSIGALLAFGPLITVFIIGYGGPAATGALTFLSASLIMAALRSDPGCEVMSLPAVFLGKHTHLACLLFSPIDWVEKKFH